MGRGQKSSEVQTRNMDVKGDSEENSDRNEEHVIGNWSKDNLCYNVTKNLN